jgi:ABC-2 type transport system permease protein
MWWHGLRSRATAADTAVAVILAFIAAMLSIALAFALSVITHVGLSDATEDAVHMALLVVFWVIGFLAVVMPIFFGAGQPQIPLRRLLVFPLSHLALYRISLAASFASGSSLFWYPILAAVTVVAVVLDGTPAFHWLVAIVIFALCLVIWCNTVLLLAQFALRRRRTRELVALVGLVLVVVVSMLPAMYQEEAEDRGEEWISDLVPPSLTLAIPRLASVFPPTIVACHLEAVVLEEDGPFSPPLMWLLLWTAAGGAIGYAIVRRDLLEGDRSARVESAVTDTKAGSVSFWAMEGLTTIPGHVRAVATKEVHYLLRSTTGKFNIVIMPIFVVVMALIVARDLDHAFLGLDRASLVFVGLMIYASMFSNNFLFNAYAWEGAGVQSFFFSPTEPAQIVLGKNLGVWLYNLILGVEGVIAFCVISGMPPLTALIGGCLAFVAALLLATVVGNFLSPTMPVPRNISSITNSPSQTAVLVTFGVLLANALVIGACLTIPAILGLAWLGPVLLLVLIGFEVGLYVTLLGPAGRFLESRRESLIEALQA